MIRFFKGILMGCLFLPFCQVIGQKSADSLRQYDLADVVVTAQYAPTDSRNAIHPVKVIKGVDVQRQGLNNLAEVLANQLNLRVNTDPILGNGLQIQGIGGENIQVMIDGVPIIGRLDGNIDLSQINLNNVERIEIIEGALSTQYGSNASGGVINIITKKSQGNQLQAESQNQYESVGIWNNSLNLGLQTDKWYASINLNRFHSQLAEESELRLYQNQTLPSGAVVRSKVNPWNPKIQYGIQGTLRYMPSDSASITYRYQLFDERVDNFGELRRPQFKPYAFDEFYNTEREDHSLHAELWLSPQLYFKTTTGYNIFERLKEVQRIDFETAAQSTIPENQDTSEFTAFLHRSMISTRTEGVFNAQAGIELLHETGTGGRIVDSTSRPFNQASLTNYALWGGLRIQATPSLLIAANLRYGHNSKFRHPLIPSVNLRWLPTKDWKLTLGYANGFRAPSLKELHFNFIDINHFIVGNPELKAEYSHNASFAVERRLEYGQHSFTLNSKLFYNYIRDRITLAEFSAARFNYQNLEQFETHGLNVELRYQFGKKLTVKSGFAYTRLYNIWTERSDTDRFTPLSEWQNELNLEIPYIQTHLALTHRFIGKQLRFFQNEGGAVEQGSIDNYHLINLSLSRNFWQKRIFFSTGIKNLLDVQAVATTGQTGGTHSSASNSLLLNWGRSYFVRMHVTLAKGY